MAEVVLCPQPLRWKLETRHFHTNYYFPTSHFLHFSPPPVLLTLPSVKLSTISLVPNITSLYTIEFPSFHPTIHFYCTACQERSSLYAYIPSLSPNVANANAPTRHHFFFLLFCPPFSYNRGPYDLNDRCVESAGRLQPSLPPARVSNAFRVSHPKPEVTKNNHVRDEPMLHPANTQNPNT